MGAGVEGCWGVLEWWRCGDGRVVSISRLVRSTLSGEFTARRLAYNCSGCKWSHWKVGENIYSYTFRTLRV